MIEELVIASNNQKKIKEIKAILKDYQIKVYSLEDLNIDIDVEENQDTFIGNAYKKAKEIYDLVKKPVLSDDSGLEIASLNNEPGIYSARYAGLDKNDEDNIDKVLFKMKDIKERQARFVCAMALIIDLEHQYQVEEYLQGEILSKREGSNGFGYDPIFYAYEVNESLGNVSAELKNKISHRAKALNKISNIIGEINNES